MEVHGFYKMALAFGLSLLLVFEALLIVKVFNNKQLLYMHSSNCSEEYVAKLNSTLNQTAAETGIHFLDRSIKLNFHPHFETGGECWSCLGDRYRKQADDQQKNLRKDNKDEYFESYDCYKKEILIEFLKGRKRPPLDNTNFRQHAFTIQNRSVSLVAGAKPQENKETSGTRMYECIFKIRGKIYKSLVPGRDCKAIHAITNI